MKNFIQSGKQITVTAPTGGATAGEPVLIGSLYGIAMHDAAVGEDVVIVREGVFSLPANAAVAAGEPVEWLAGEVNEVAAGVRIGVAVSVSAGVAVVALD